MINLQSLEPRLCYAANPMAVDLMNGILTVTGTNKSDSITIDWGSEDGSTVNVVTTTVGPNSNKKAALASQTYSFPSSSIQSIHVDAGNGHDTINVSAMTFSATLIGGNGKDTIMGSQAGGYINGGNGADFIQSFGGTNMIVAGLGNDRLKIGTKDVYMGSRGKDKLLD